MHKTAQKEQQKKHPDDKIEEKKKRSKPAEKGKRTVDDQSSNSEADKKGAMSKTKKKKVGIVEFAMEKQLSEISVRPIFWLIIDIFSEFIESVDWASARKSDNNRG